MTKPDGGSPFDKELRAEDTSEAIAKLRDYEDESADPDVVEFAKFMSGRLNPSLVPMGFVMASQLALYDLDKGISGYTGETIESPITHSGEVTYLKLTKATPDLARMAFSEEFGDAVEQHMIQAGILTPTPEESKTGEDLSEDEIFTDEIDGIKDAYTKIVVDARERVVSLDWQQFGIDLAQVYKMFEVIYPLILRQAPYHLPLTMLSVNHGKDARYILDIPEHQKMEISDGIYLALVVPTVPASQATLARDHLFLMAPEALAKMSGLDPEDVIKKLAGANPRSSMGRAAIRMHTQLQRHPELIRNQ